MLPAVGYGDAQPREMGETLAAAACEAVILGTPVDLGRLIRIPRPVHRVRYAYEDRSRPGRGGPGVVEGALPRESCCGWPA